MWSKQANICIVFPPWLLWTLMDYLNLLLHYFIKPSQNSLINFYWGNSIWSNLDDWVYCNKKNTDPILNLLAYCNPPCPHYSTDNQNIITPLSSHSTFRWKPGFNFWDYEWNWGWENWRNSRQGIGEADNWSRTTKSQERCCRGIKDSQRINKEKTHIEAKTKFGSLLDGFLNLKVIVVLNRKKYEILRYLEECNFFSVLHVIGCTTYYKEPLYTSWY